MDKTASGWTILDRDAGLLCREYAFAKNATALTFVARMADGGLVAISPGTGFGEDAFADLASFGEVKAIVAPNGFHHLGVEGWRRRFPEAGVYAAPETAARVAKKNPAAGAFEPLSALAAKTGPDLVLAEVANSKAGETWLSAKTARGHVWFVSDILANIPRLPPNPFVKLLFWASGSAPGYRVFNLALKILVKDRKACLRTLADEMRARPPVMVVPSHGELLAEPGIAERTQALLAAAT
jgi:hypothetical protein